MTKIDHNHCSATAAHLFWGAFTMAALMFWSMKKRSESVKPRPIAVRMPLAGSVST